MAENFLSQLATNPSSVHKAPVNHYQHFINASVYFSCGIKGAEHLLAVFNSQVNYKVSTTSK